MTLPPAPISVAGGPTPVELVLSHYRLPPHIEKLHPLQVEAINSLALLHNGGEFLDMGCGKTLVFTMVALYHRLVHGWPAVVVMPPILLTQWLRWLLSIVAIEQRDRFTVTKYAGTPAHRKKLSLDSDFVLVGAQIFRKEFTKFKDHYSRKKNYIFGVDEATMIAGIESTLHENCYDFAIGHPTQLLTGTPMNKVLDAYGLIKFTSPGTYRNYKHFENDHVDEVDFFGKAVSFKNLDKLRDNLKTNAVRILYSDMYSDVEEPIYQPIEYELDPKHYALYEQLAEAQILALPDGGKIDASTVQRLRHALGQIVVNWDHFSGDSTKVSAGIELIEQKLGELGDGKLMVFADYKMTVRNLVARLSKYGAVQVNSEVTAKQKDQAKDRFIDDPKCRVIVVQVISGGKGLDGLQHVCNHALFVEPCQQPRDFHQAVSRLKRMGQKKRVWIGIAKALGTTQVHGFRNLLENDALVNKVVRNVADLRDMIYGR